MRRTSRDFLELEFMTEWELNRAIREATSEMEDLLQYLKILDEEAESARGFTVYVPLQPILDEVGNLEGYIRKAENLMLRFENKRYLSRADKLKSYGFNSPFKRRKSTISTNTLQSAEDVLKIDFNKDKDYPVHTSKRRKRI